MAVSSYGWLTGALLAGSVLAADGEFLAPSPGDLTRAEALFGAELAGQPRDWGPLGLRRQAQGDAVWLREPEGQRQGRGLFAWRPPGAARPWLLQAPHEQDDAHTGALARLWFQDEPIQAAQWNSLGRDAVDLAHRSDSHWQAMTRAFAARWPRGRVIQLHGFAAEKRKTPAGAGLDLILSAGHRDPPAWVRGVAACLKDRLAPLRVGLYPDDVQELGGTTNAQGQLLRGLGHGGFLHLEMSLALRERLVEDKALRDHFVHCWSTDGP